MKKELTVIIPVYNGKEQYLDRCLMSLEKAHNNIAKILLIDDVSDYTYDDFIKRYNLDISIYRNNNNIGVGASRKKGKDIADTQWVSFIDQDDYVFDNYFDSFYKNMKAFPDVKMFIYPRIVRQGRKQEDKLIEIEEETVTNSAIHFGGNFYHKDIFNIFGIEMSENRMSDDIFLNSLLGDFFYSVPEYEKYFGVMNDAKPIYMWEHTNLLSQTLSSENYITCEYVVKAHEEIKSFILDYCEKNPDSYFVKFWCIEEYGNMAISMCEDHIKDSFLRYLVYKLPEEEINIITDFLEGRITIYKEIEKKLKYLELNEIDLELLTDMHVCIIMNRANNDDMWKIYWEIQNRDPEWTLDLMQSYCDNLRCKNAKNAISKGDYAYIKELSLYEIVDGALDFLNNRLDKYISQKNNSSGGAWGKV